MLNITSPFLTRLPSTMGVPESVRDNCLGFHSGSGGFLRTEDNLIGIAFRFFGTVVVSVVVVSVVVVPVMVVPVVVVLMCYGALFLFRFIAMGIPAGCEPAACSNAENSGEKDFYCLFHNKMCIRLYNKHFQVCKYIFAYMQPGCKLSGTYFALSEIKKGGKIL